MNWFAQLEPQIPSNLGYFQSQLECMNLTARIDPSEGTLSFSTCPTFYSLPARFILFQLFEQIKMSAVEIAICLVLNSTCIWKSCFGYLLMHRTLAWVWKAYHCAFRKICALSIPSAIIGSCFLCLFI